MPNVRCLQTQYEPMDASQYTLPQQSILGAFVSGLKTGAKANVNGLSSAVVSTATIGIWDKVEPWPVTELDRAYGYDAAFAISNASGNILVGVASGGAGCWAKGAGTTGKIVGYGLKGIDIGGNAVGMVKNGYDIYDNGPNIGNVIGFAGNAGGLAGNLKSACFTAGTQIVVGMETIEDELGNLTTVYTTINIEDVQVGDLVYSYNTQTGEVELRAVTSTLAKTSDHINSLTIVDENGHEQVIETTDVHPFWVVTDTPDLKRAARSVVDENGVWLYHENVTPTEFGYWVEAKDLRVGDVFLGANGELSTLTGILRVEQSGSINVFNFSVEGNHNYFILAQGFELGQSSILVHNTTVDCEILYRRGTRRQKVEDIAEQCRAAEINPKSNFTHGISVSGTVPAKPARSALRSDVEKHFTVHDTKLDWDPLHKTVEFPKPVTPESVDIFYSIFKSGN